jgi:hypothetical protein
MLTQRSQKPGYLIALCLAPLLISLSACQFNPLKTTPEIPVTLYSQEQQDLAQLQAETLFQQYYQYQIDSSPVLRSTLAMPGQFEWDDISALAQQEYIEKIQQFRQQLIAVEQGALSAGNH